LGFCVSRVMLKIGLAFVQVTKDRHAIIFHDDYIITEDKVLSQDSLLIVILNIIANTPIWKLFRLIAGLGHTGSCNLCTMKLWRLQSIGEIGGTKSLHQSVLITWTPWCCCTGSKENWGYYIGRISWHRTSKEFCHGIEMVFFSCQVSEECWQDSREI
jgi:hypothetical protein